MSAGGLREAIREARTLAGVDEAKTDEQVRMPALHAADGQACVISCTLPLSCMQNYVKIIKYNKRCTQGSDNVQWDLKKVKQVPPICRR